MHWYKGNKHEGCCKITNKYKKSAATNFRKGNQIDGMWASEGVNFHGEKCIRIWNVVGYHRVWVVYITYV